MRPTALSLGTASEASVYRSRTGITVSWGNLAVCILESCSVDVVAAESKNRSLRHGGEGEIWWGLTVCVILKMGCVSGVGTRVGGGGVDVFSGFSCVVERVKEVTEALEAVRQVRSVATEARSVMGSRTCG